MLFLRLRGTGKVTHMFPVCCGCDAASELSNENKENNIGDAKGKLSSSPVEDEGFVQRTGMR